MKEALLQNIIASGARVGAGKIGALYGNGDVSSPIHKGLHLTLGGFVGALSNVQAPLQGAISGAFAGVMAEVIAEALTQTPAESLRETLLESNDNPHAFSQFLERFETHVERRTDLAHLITVGIASALNLDLATASRVANNAVKNNMAKLFQRIALALVATKQCAKMDKEGTIALLEKTGLTKEEATDAVEWVLLGGTLVEISKGKLGNLKIPKRGLKVPVKNTVKVVNKTGVFKLIPVKNTVPVKVKNRVTFFEQSQNPPVKNTLSVKNEGIKLKLEFKEGMNPRDFDRKVISLKNAVKEGKLENTIPHSITKNERSALTRKYRKDLVSRVERRYQNNLQSRENALTKLDNSDIDHKIDLQLGGNNTRDNLRTLDSFTNQDLGRQIAKQLQKTDKKLITDILTN